MINNKYPNISPSLNLDFTNSNTIDPRITFSRASAATYYDGRTVAKAEENLLTYSQEFDNSAWGKSGATVLSNATAAPDGSTTADLIVANTSNVPHCVFRSSAATEATISFYAKSGGYNFVAVCDAAGGQIGQFTVDLTNGVISENSASIQASVANAGGGWWRVVLYKIFANAFQLQIGPTDSSTGGSVYNTGVFPGDGISGIYLWGAQLEQRSQVTAYAPTTTQPITNYIPVLQTALSGVPRIDHDPVTGECKGLLIEEQRTNLLTYSEQFDHVNWNKKGTVTVASNTAAAPDGSFSADKLLEIFNSVNPRALQTYPQTVGNVYSFSMFVKASERTQIRLSAEGSAFKTAYFNLITGAIVSQGSGLTSAASVAVGNGWYRCSITWTAAVAQSDTYVGTAMQGAPATGDGYSGIYIWGAQLEVGAFPTSYIKTEASQVTRAADSASMTGANFSSWYRQDEGTLFADASTNMDVTISSNRANTLTLNDGTIGNVVHLGPNAVGGANVMYAYTSANGAAGQCAITTTLGGVKAYKIALSMKVNDFALSLSGSVPATDTSGSVTTSLTMMGIGSRVGAFSDGYQNGHIKRITYYPKRLTDAQLQALTA